MRRFFTVMVLGGVAVLAACGGSESSKQTYVVNTVEWWDTTTAVPNPYVGPPSTGEGGIVDTTVEAGTPNNTPSSTSSSTSSGTPSSTPSTTTAPVNLQIATNFSAQIAERLNQKTGGVTAKQIQDAAAKWETEARGEITVAGWEGVRVENVERGVAVIITISKVDTKAYVCAGPAAIVSPGPCG
jgi:ABC-type glycerol-3-phosphate transport system substrate-binding protein